MLFDHRHSKRWMVFGWIVCVHNTKYSLNSIEIGWTIKSIVFFQMGISHIYNMACNIVISVKHLTQNSNFLIVLREAVRHNIFDSRQFIFFRQPKMPKYSCKIYGFFRVQCCWPIHKWHKCIFAHSSYVIWWEWI